VYGKIFASMFDGSLYGNWKAIVTFQQMIILCDADGVLDMTPHALAARTSIPLDVLREGLEVLEAPDQYSRSPEQDGRRIERLDGHRPWGWRIVNYRRYRMMVDAETVREQNRARQQRHREQLRAVTARDGHVTAPESNATALESNATSRSVAQVTRSNAKSRQAEAEVINPPVVPPLPKCDTTRQPQHPASPSAPPAAGKPLGKPPDRGTRLALDALPGEWRAWAVDARADLDPDDAWLRFVDHWAAQPGQRGRKADWFATWRNWVRHERAPLTKPPPKLGYEKPEWLQNIL
jgi:hypothetical protein